MGNVLETCGAGGHRDPPDGMADKRKPRSADMSTASANSPNPRDRERTPLLGSSHLPGPGGATSTGPPLPNPSPFAGWGAAATGTAGAAGQGHGKELDKNTETWQKMRFIRKVYTLLACQMLATLVISGAFHVFAPSMEKFDHDMEGFLLPTVTGLVVLLLLMVFCLPDMARTAPIDYFLLFGLTVTVAVLIEVVNAALESFFAIQLWFDVTFVIITLAIHASCCLRDHAQMLASGAAIILTTTLADFVLLMLADSGATASVPSTSGADSSEVAKFSTDWWVKILVLLLVPTSFCFFIVYDLYTIVRGKHKHKFDVDEYVFATLSLFADVTGGAILAVSPLWVLDSSDLHAKGQKEENYKTTHPGTQKQKSNEP